MSFLKNIADAVLPAESVEVPVINHFNLQRYLGQWFEIARIENRYERDMYRVAARYERDADGSIRVINSGYDSKTGMRKESVAKAKQGDAPNRLKVYFIPMIYGRYQVAWIDPDYSLALVAGGTKDYLWILSRSPHCSMPELEPLLRYARKLGYDTNRLIYTQAGM